jgi:hypothetical protein
MVSSRKQQALENKRERQKADRMTKTLLKKAYKLDQLRGVDVALGIRKRGRFYLLNIDSLPGPEEIVS